MMREEMQQIHQNVEAVKARIAAAAQAAGKNPEDIFLVAASKMNDAERVQESISAGIRICGENRVQELLDKYEQNAYEGSDLHFIGTLQSNKVKYLIGKVSLIHSVSSMKLLQTIEKEASKKNIRQDILLEINIGDEDLPEGITRDEADDLLHT